MNILYIEDDLTLASIVKEKLYGNYNLDIVDTAEQAFVKIQLKPYSLIIVDYYLPDINGVDFCKKLRVEEPSIPVLFLTVIDEKNNIIEALNSGADDYLSKPFNFLELEARIGVLIRRYCENIEMSFSIGQKLKINYQTKKVFCNNIELKIPRKEYLLLKFFILHPRRIISRNELFENVWSDADFYNSNTIDVHVRRLRKKLKACDNNINIESIYGEGYRFSEK